MRRRWRVALAILLASAIVIVYCFSRPAGVTWFGYTRIRLGMTAEKVESVIGVPPGNYSSRKDIKIVDFWDSEWHEGKPGDGKKEIWYSEDGCLRVTYDADGKVVYRVWAGMVDHGPSFLERMKRLVGL